MQLRSFGLSLAAVFLSSLLAGRAPAQTSPSASASAPASRIAGDWRSTAPVAIPNSKPPMNASASDLGAAPSSQVLSRMLLLLAPAPARQQALAAELASLQDSSSPHYRQWLTPPAFAQAYANSPSDVAAVTAWLESQGFTVATLPASLGWIEFSGTVAQVEQAFGAQIHLVATPGGARPALATGISVPGALAPLVAGLVSLDGVVSAPALTAPQPLAVSPADLAALTSPANAAALTPRLAAQLLDFASTSADTTNNRGAGETIAIVSRSNVNSADIAAFRSALGLPASPLAIALNGPDPGLAPGVTNDPAEATLAASWAGAAAPGAQILLAPAATTSATDGIDLSLAVIVDQDLANVAAVGYSACEASLSPAHQAFYAALYQQASAEGISIIAASGDSGAAACTPAGGTAPVTTGLAVNALASTPWNTVVGVAGYEAGGAAAGSTALAAWSPVNAADPAYAGGGGSSTLYARPGWQPIPAQLTTGGITVTRNRFLPDLALPTAIDSGFNPGLAFCFSSSTVSSGASTGCTLVRSGGSSAATAIFAGVAALIDQKYGAQGNLAPSLYATSRTGGVFNDVQQGTAQLPCAAGSAGCGAGGQIGYTAASGYDLATGLGVPDVQQLVNRFASPAVAAVTPNVSLTVSPVQANNAYNPSSVVTFTARVVDPTGAGIPGGTVTISDLSNYDILTPDATLVSSGSTASGSKATFTLELSSFYNYSGPKTYNLGIFYNDPTGTYNSFDSSTLLTVTSELSPTVLLITPSSNSPALGSSVTVTVTTSVGASGPPAGSAPPTGPVTLNVNGVALTPVSLSTTGGVTSAAFTFQVTQTTNSIYASYPGDSNYSGTTTSPYTLTASRGTAAVVLTANSTTVGPGVGVVLTATVTPTTPPVAGAEQNPTGTVVFYLGTTVVGSGTLTPSPNSDSSTATLTLQTLPGGVDSLTAVYGGDSTYGSATSNLLTITIQGFTLTPSPYNPPENLDIVQGGAGAESFIVTSVGGYTSLVQVICTVPTQDDMTCAVSPQQVTPTATVTFVVQTYVTGGPEYATTLKPQKPNSLWPGAAGGAALAALVFFLLPFGRRARIFLRQGPQRFLILLMLLAGLVGAAVGCTSTAALTPYGTPLGVSTLKVTATAYVDNVVTSQSVYFTVDVTAP
jgi:hypothetical protein